MKSISPRFPNVQKILARKPFPCGLIGRFHLSAKSPRARIARRPGQGKPLEIKRSGRPPQIGRTLYNPMSTTYLPPHRRWLPTSLRQHHRSLKLPLVSPRTQIKAQSHDSGHENLMVFMVAPAVHLPSKHHLMLRACKLLRMVPGSNKLPPRPDGAMFGFANAIL